MRIFYASLCVIIFTVGSLKAGPLYQAAQKECTNESAIRFLNSFCDQEDVTVVDCFSVATDLWEHIAINPHLSETSAKLGALIETIKNVIYKYRMLLIRLHINNQIENDKDDLIRKCKILVRLIIPSLEKEEVKFKNSLNMDENLKTKLIMCSLQTLFIQKYAQCPQPTVEVNEDKLFEKYFSDKFMQIVHFNMMDITQLERHELANLLSDFRFLLYEDLPLLGNYEFSYRDEAKKLLLQLAHHGLALDGKRYKSLCAMHNVVNSLLILIGRALEDIHFNAHRVKPKVD